MNLLYLALLILVWAIPLPWVSWGALQTVCCLQLWNCHRSTATSSANDIGKVRSQEICLLTLCASLLLFVGLVIKFSGLLIVNSDLPVAAILVVCSTGGLVGALPVPLGTGRFPTGISGKASRSTRKVFQPTNAPHETPSPDASHVESSLPPESASRSEFSAWSWQSFRLNDSAFTGRLTSVLLGATLLQSLIHHTLWSERELAIVAVVSLCILILTAIRLRDVDSALEQLHLATCLLYGNAGIASVLAGWEKLHPDRLWSITSNLPSGDWLFAAILVTEASALFAWYILLPRVNVNDIGSAPGQEPSRPSPEWRTSGPISTTSNQAEPVATETPSASKHSMWQEDKSAEAKDTPVAADLLWRSLEWIARGSLAGLPPLPGLWWRMLLLAALLLPQERSVITSLTEPHAGFVALSLTYAVCLTWTGIAILQKPDELTAQNSLLNEQKDRSLTAKRMR